ncbi:MAG: ATP-binding protein [Kordiimonadaceae bacterium]|nr:ATP-binding protein [Kordiimonadaceae bacterium]
MVVSIISRAVFDFAVWSRGNDARPILLVCEEAHRYVPTDNSTIFNSTRKAIERIAKEGRKYGVSLGLVSQRPADVSESALSQCGTILPCVLTMNGTRNLCPTSCPRGPKDR